MHHEEAVQPTYYKLLQAITRLPNLDYYITFQVFTEIVVFCTRPLTLEPHTACRKGNLEI